MKKWLAFSLIILIVGSFIFAEDDGFQKIQDYVVGVLIRLIRFAFALIMIVSGGILMFLGFKYLLSKGNIKELHQAFLYVILGLIVLFLALFAPNLLKNFLESFNPPQVSP